MSFDDLDLVSLRARPAEKWRQYPGDDVLAAWVADMDFPVAEPIQRVLSEMLGLTDLGYPLNPKLHDLPTLLAERAAQRFDWHFDARQVEVLADVVQGLYVSLLVYSEEGQSALVQTPIYAPFFAATRDTRRPAAHSPLVQGSAGYEIDFDALEASITPDLRTFMLCNPHNPTGRVFTRAELERLAEIAIAHDLIVLADEIHWDLVYPGATHTPFATLGPEVAARTVSFVSATKSFNIAGLRCAFAVFGSDELRERFHTIPRHVRGGMASFGLAATRVAWEECDDWLDGVVRYLGANRDFLADFLARELPDVRHSAPQGTYLAWLDCRALGLEPSPFRFFLDKARVALSDGPVFGPDSEGFVRLNFATSCNILTEILERMAKAVASR